MVTPSEAERSVFPKLPSTEIWSDALEAARMNQSQGYLDIKMVRVKNLGVLEV